MKDFIRLKPFILFILFVLIMLIVPSLNASNSASNSDHETIMKQQIGELRAIQNQIFSLSQVIICQLPEDRSKIKREINFINTRVAELSKEITNYSATTPSMSSQNRDALLSCIALNLLRNALYQLHMLTNTNNNVDRSLLLEDFYLFKRVSTETLNTLERNF